MTDFQLRSIHSGSAHEMGITQGPRMKHLRLKKKKKKCRNPYNPYYSHSGTGGNRGEPPFSIILFLLPTTFTAWVKENYFCKTGGMGLKVVLGGLG